VTSTLTIDHASVRGTARGLEWHPFCQGAETPATQMYALEWRWESTASRGMSAAPQGPQQPGRILLNTESGRFWGSPKPPDCPFSRICRVLDIFGSQMQGLQARVLTPREDPVHTSLMRHTPCFCTPLASKAYTVSCGVAMLGWKSQSGGVGTSGLVRTT
jgi:hypothetical protein